MTASWSSESRKKKQPKAGSSFRIRRRKNPSKAKSSLLVPEKKATMGWRNTFFLAVMAGAFIAFGAIFATTVITGASGQLTLGVTKLLGGLVFCLGLILVIVAGAELFTGNNLLVMAWADHQITTSPAWTPGPTTCDPGTLAPGASEVDSVVISVDHFKRFNDRWGHAAGDQALRMVAAGLAEVGGGGRTDFLSGHKTLAAGVTIGEMPEDFRTLAEKAFAPGPLPFPLLHVDTTWKFQDMYRYREKIEAELKGELIKHVNKDGVAMGMNPFDFGSKKYTDVMKTEGLKQALTKYEFDCAFGGARRDEEKSRAKERIFSFRDSHHQWDPKNQRPELWTIYNAKIKKGENVRVFPLSNWTELDVWLYIHEEELPMVPLYLAKERPVVERDGARARQPVLRILAINDLVKQLILEGADAPVAHVTHEGGIVPHREDHRRVVGRQPAQFEALRVQDRPTHKLFRKIPPLLSTMSIAHRSPAALPPR